MRSNAQILWIDDNPERRKRATQLAEDTGMNVEFISVKGKNVEKVLPDIRKSYRPSLVIIDHVLNNTTSEGWARFGSTLTGFFRETWKGCPVFGITAGKNLKDIDIERYAYDELIDNTDFSEYVQYIPNVVEGFKKCCKVKDFKGWIRLLKVPAEEVDRIRACMPHDAKTDIGKRGFASRAYRWFRMKIYRMPGFLYDKNWVATFAGVKQDRMEKYLKRLDNAAYGGVFNDPYHPRWWKVQLYEAIYSKCKDKNATCRSTQDVANEVLKVNKRDQSTCYVCHKKWPETVGYVDESADAGIKQMHLKCTVAHPSYRYEPMFEQIRMMGEK